ncbi:MAG: hypothetical protein P4L73_07085 [Caulobacteraceae bacterium]|nr:hypothetical protein [Caulobacteraceae bacterium]
MTQVDVLDAGRQRSAGYKVDVSRGARIGRVSSEWFSRPADERFLSLADLFASVRERTERSRTRTVESAAIRVEASRDDAERLALTLPGSSGPVAPTHWSFGQLASLVGAPAAYLMTLFCSAQPHDPQREGISQRPVANFAGCSNPNC